jgi:hypothetical protein
VTALEQQMSRALAPPPSKCADYDRQSFLALHLRHTARWTYSDRKKCMYNSVGKMFLQEHCGKLGTDPVSPFSTKHFRFIVID